MQSKKGPQLESLKNHIKKEISKGYRSIESFCYANDINKSTLSRFLAGTRNLKINTLISIVEKLKLQVVLKPLGKSNRKR